MSMSPIEKRHDRAWREGMDQLLSTLAAPAAELALEEGLSDKQAEEAATSHLKSLGKVRAHFRDERRIWLMHGGPSRAVVQAKSNLKVKA